MRSQGLTTGSVLVIEDDESQRLLITQILEAARIGVVSASDGAAGIQKCENQQFDLVITDIQMPRMRGNEVISAIRSSKMNKSTPIVVVSGTLDKDLITQISNQVSKIFVKPISPKEFSESIHSLLAQKAP